MSASLGLDRLNPTQVNGWWLWFTLGPVFVGPTQRKLPPATHIPILKTWRSIFEFNFISFGFGTLFLGATRRSLQIQHRGKTRDAGVSMIVPPLQGCYNAYFPSGKLILTSLCGCSKFGWNPDKNAGFCLISDRFGSLARFHTPLVLLIFDARGNHELVNWQRLK